ncbi:MAG: hypothetical protein JCHSAcid_07810 [uncultured Acidilobus sp. JCHS]|jgi:hypothetical protein|nr:MAG: hypothetical protein JCHSAcid_07810 [uncultured Acidilobus sp. JCHS]
MSLWTEPGLIGAEIVSRTALFKSVSKLYALQRVGAEVL